MSTKPNHRRATARSQDNGPHWEGGGSDNSAVARARKSWKRLRARSERRAGAVTKFFSRRVTPPLTD